MRNLLATFVFLLASQQVLAQQPFQTFDMIVTDPAGVVAALDKRRVLLVNRVLQE